MDPRNFLIELSTLVPSRREARVRPARVRPPRIGRVEWPSLTLVHGPNSLSLSPGLPLLLLLLLSSTPQLFPRFFMAALKTFFFFLEDRASRLVCSRFVINSRLIGKLSIVIELLNVLLREREGGQREGRIERDKALIESALSHSLGNRPVIHR